MAMSKEETYERRKTRYHQLKEDGICTSCGQRKATHGIVCERCYQTRKASYKRCYERDKKARGHSKDWTSYGWRHGRSDLAKEMLRLMAKYPDMPPAAYGRMKVREYWEAQGVKTT